MSGSDDAPVMPVIEEPDVLEEERRRVEPGTPRLEHAAFVILGVLVTILVFLSGIEVL